MVESGAGDAAGGGSGGGGTRWGGRETWSDPKYLPNILLVAPAPHWLTDDPVGLKRLVESLRLLGSNPNHIYSYGQLTYSESGSLGVPSLVLDYPSFEYRKSGENKDFLNLATTACHRLDFIAKKAGAWGPECQVTQIIEPPQRGDLTPVPGGRIGDYFYTIRALGEDHVRFILENGAGKKVDVTVHFRNVKFVPEGGALDSEINDVGVEKNNKGQTLRFPHEYC